MAALPGIGIFGTNAAVHLLTPVFREKVRALETCEPEIHIRIPLSHFCGSRSCL